MQAARACYGLWEQVRRCVCGKPLHWNGAAPSVATGDGIWRHARLLPPVEVFHRITLGEPLTPIRRVDGLDLLLPTGAFKGSGGHVVDA